MACSKIDGPFQNSRSLFLASASVFLLKFLVETPRMRFVLSFIVSLLSSWLISLVTAHNIRVEPRRRGTISPFHAQSPKSEKFSLTFWFVECFYEDLHKDDKMTVTFLAGPGDEGNIDIDFWVNTRSLLWEDVNGLTDYESVRSSTCQRGSDAEWRLFV